MNKTRIYAMSQATRFPAWIKLSPYLVFGLLVFVFNSATSSNYWVKGYLTILELQAGIILIYFVITKLKKQKNHRL
jgi:hypothetical protein